MSEIDNKSLSFKTCLSTLRQKGNLAYEYNPLYNYQTDVDLYLIDNKYIVPAGQAVNTKNGEILTKKSVYVSSNLTDFWVDKRGKKFGSNLVRQNDPNDPNDNLKFIVEAESGGTLWAKAGSLIDLDTEQLNFDLDHPVEIEVQPSYDGSVNLILNDDKNIPRIINSRFSVREKDTYEIVDRIGENDTNIYNSKTFDKDTSLYFQYEYNPTITYLGFIKGVLPVGQYCFYFTYCDADENESDYIAESGLIPVFMGNDSDPRSMDGGIKNQRTTKGIKLRLNNIDKSYNYIKIYYVRYFADYQQNRVFECKKINRKYPINSGTICVQVTGDELSEDLDANILNISRFNPKNLLTQAQCKNMLFFGNIVKNSDNYRELTDLALRIVPQLGIDNNFDNLNDQYLSDSGDFAYYNSLNIYNKTGYFNQEYYRFGVVFIYQNGTLSSVYNTLGGVLDDSNSLSLTGELYKHDDNMPILIRNYVKTDDYGWVKKSDAYELSGENINGKGVCLFNHERSYTDRTIFYVKFNVPKEVSKQLKEELGIRGLFFVRQKCVPNILAQCYLLGIDETLEGPVLETGTGDSKEHYTECFISDELILKHDISSRLHKYSQEGSLNDSISKVAFAGLCPDFSLNQPYYNQIFNGGSFKLQKVSYENSGLTRTDRFFNEDSRVNYKIQQEFKKVTICSVSDNVPSVAIKDKVFKLNMGQTEEVFRFKYAEVDSGTYNAGDQNFDEINKASNLVRGTYSPYLAIYSNSGKLETGCLYNIYQDVNVSPKQEFQNRMDSSEPFYAISDRYNLILQDNSNYNCWRGDCFINQYTHRMVRNFNDPTLPNNDQIIDKNTWKNNYKVEDQTKWADISRSDVNAVQLGTWITFKVRSAMNYALRSVDHSYVSEEALMGSPRSFFPRSTLLQRGANKMPDSYLYNDAYRASLGFKCYFTLQDINYIKDTFSNRIQYSAIAIQDSYKNNYRYSLSTYFRDYSQEYGSIQKLIGFEGYLLVIFEHGIGIAVINERVLAGGGDGEPVFINTANVLPEELTIISDTYGTQWGDSVVKSESGAVYGVDTIAKKIWRVKGQTLEILSDFKVNKFLVDNITLSERELYPTIGLKNVKTHYNNNKKDIIFTFYDDVYKDEEKAWSLCYNELFEQFVTFYSWIPSYSENIDTKFFTFDRNTAKSLSLLAKSNYSIPENHGVLLDNPVCKEKTITLEEEQDGEITETSYRIIILPDIYYVDLNKTKLVNYTIVNDDGTKEFLQSSIEGTSSDETGQYVFKDVKFRIEKDHWQHYKLFDIASTTIDDQTTYKLALKTGVSFEDLYDVFEDHKVIQLYITPYLSSQSNVIDGLNDDILFRTELVAFTLSSIVENPLLTQVEKDRGGLTTDFYLHGQAGIFDVVEDLYPTYWYNDWHPFEFEFIVNDKIAQQKIFNNLIIISNNAEPESFHFEIEGDNYEFSKDKRAMYFRQESTKELYQNLGSDIIFNRYYTDVVATKRTQEQYYRGGVDKYTRRVYSDYETYYKKEGPPGVNPYRRSGIDRVYPVYSEGLVQQVKSTIFPLYYERLDTYNDIYHKYHLMHDDDGVYDFQNLSGSEISWNRDLNQFNIITHIKNSQIDLVGRLRGNSRYKEGTWNVQIPSITFMQKNEEDQWPLAQGSTTLRVPPIIVNSQSLPNDLQSTDVSEDKLPNMYGLSGDYIKTEDWTYRKETKIRDKWIKIRIRYSGKNLAVIHSLITLYTLSYS